MRARAVLVVCAMDPSLWTVARPPSPLAGILEFIRMATIAIALLAVITGMLVVVPLCAYAAGVLLSGQLARTELIALCTGCGWILGMMTQRRAITVP